MFLAGLKFALGLMTGVSLFTCASLFLIWSIELAGNWRKKRRHMQMAEGTALHLVIPQRRVIAELRNPLLADAWKEAQHRSKYLQ
jgi:hypothetical protein